ncbi:DUF559 domain-containing protein [Microbacterium sp. NEAU-LLC]|uniref:DUF559 domain-containing protein n=1 Tax=Microbacterium helvum TaxID=2773713 RepID=A0ABR8NLR6_9MICO|nr:DUF559 domain-containing protein [Microbacterium helvum]MBD3941387.1 DUF559 domain-containing protein [Microbacterium helvum]
MKRTPLPEHLGRTFTVGAARAAGVSGSRLRAGDLDAPYRGVRVVKRVAAVDAGTPPVRESDRSQVREQPQGESDALELRERALTLALTMPPNQFFTHVTAAILWGLPVPASLLRDSFGRLRDLDVGVFAPARHPRHAGVRGHQLRSGRNHVVVHAEHGVRLSSAASTWASLASVVRDEYDLVALGDAVVREPMFTNDPPALATMAQLAAAVGAGRRIGVAALRAALPRVRTRSASRMETRCRLILVDAGLPEPELNHEVRGADGGLVACVDLAYAGHKIAIEYEGEHHLTDPDQWTKDIARYEALAAAGWFVIRVTKSQVFDARGDLVLRVRRALSARA